MRPRRLLALSLFSISAVTACYGADLPTPVQNLIEQARADCAGFENGALSVQPDAVRRVDLTGNGVGDWVVDHGHLICSTAASMYCGTGGCSLSLIVGDTVTERLSKGWDTVALGPMQVVLLQVHGANCGGTNLNSCVEALVWDQDDHRFYSTLDLGQ